MPTAPPPDPSPPAGDPPASSADAVASRLVRRVVLLSMLGAAVFVALALATDAGKFVGALRGFPPSALAAALGAVLLGYGVRLLRWRLYLARLGVRLPLKDDALVFFAGFAMSITPAKLGEVLKAALLWELHAVPMVRTAPLVIAERLSDLLALVVLASLGALAFPFGAPAALVGGAAVAVGSLVAGHAPTGAALLAQLTRVPWLRARATKLEAAYRALHGVSSGATLFQALLLSLVAWSLEAVGAWIIVTAYPSGAAAPPLGVTFAYAASQVAGALSFLPGGLGVAEAGMTGLLARMGDAALAPAEAAAATTLVRLATLWFAVLLGAFALGRARRVIRARRRGA